MSIALVDVTKQYRTLQGKHTVYRNFNLKIGRKDAVGIIGHNGAGKSTLLKLICGAEMPDKGQILRNMSVSWPVGYSGFFSPDQTGTSNAAFCARLYGRNTKEVVQYVREFSGLGEFMDWPLKGYSSGMRQKLAFALSLSIRFDCMLFDEVLSAGDMAFREKATKAIETLRSRSAFVMVTHDLKAVIKHCERVVVIERGKPPIVSDDVKATVKDYYFRRRAATEDASVAERGGY
jgi:capsular polysaccharide transport system ATP-binding protein